MISRSTASGRRFLLHLLLIAQIAAHLADDGLLLNGDFEAETPMEADGAVEGWATKGMVEKVEPGQKQGAMLIVVPHGRRAVRLSNDAEISQLVKVEKGSLYGLTFNAARTCAQDESLNVSVPPASQVVDLQTVHSVRGYDAYATAFAADGDSVAVTIKNPGMEDDPTCGPVIDDIAIKKLFTPDKVKGNAVVNGDLEEGPWLSKNDSLGVLLPTNFDEAESPLPGWNVESNRPVRYIDSDHFAVPQGKRAIQLLSGKEGIISQMVQTVPKKEYQLTFLLGEAGDKCKHPLAVRAFAGDQANTIHYAANANTTHQLAALNFTAKAENTRIAFLSVYYNVKADDMTSLCGPVIDDVRVLASGSAHYRPRWLVLGLGLLGFILL